jgi:hypothetical protein
MIGLFGSHADTSVVLGPLSSRGKGLGWTSQPTGNIGGPKMFGDDGRLNLAAIRGVTGQSPSVFADCLSPHRSRLVVRLPLRLGLAPYVRDPRRAGGRVRSRHRAGLVVAGHPPPRPGSQRSVELGRSWTCRRTRRRSLR